MTPSVKSCNRQLVARFTGVSIVSVNNLIKDHPDYELRDLVHHALRLRAKELSFSNSWTMKEDCQWFADNLIDKTMEKLVVNSCE